MLKQLLGPKGEDLQNLFATSFELVKVDSIQKIYFARLVFSAFLHVSFFLSISMIFYNWNRGLGITLFAFSFLFLAPYSFFYHIKKRALISWYTYAGVTQQNSTESHAKLQISQIAWSLRFLAITEFFISNRSTGSNENSIWDALKNFFVNSLALIFDVAENYLLPTIVIEKVSIQDAVPKLTQMKQNVPASLAGAFGVDLIAEAIQAFSFIVHFVVIGLGILLALGLSSTVPLAFRSQFGNINFFLLPLVASLFISSYIGSFLKISATSLKAIYFSIFYTAINRPQEIKELYRAKVTNYLNTAPL